MIDKSAKKALKNVTIPFPRDNLPVLVSNIAPNAASNAINKFERRISGKGVVRAGKGLESLEKSGLLIDGTSETVKHEIKKQEDGFLGTMMAPMSATLIAPVAS